MESSSTIRLLGLLTTLVGVSVACNKGYVVDGHHGHYGWGHGPQPVIILPKPTLIPKLKHAFHEGKLLVDYHKIIGPSLKPLPYKKGVGWLHHNHVGIHDYFGHGHHGIGKSGYVGFKGEIGWHKGPILPVIKHHGHLGHKHIGLGHGHIGPGHHLGHGHIGPGHGHLGHGHIGVGHGHLGHGHIGVGHGHIAPGHGHLGHGHIGPGHGHLGHGHIGPGHHLGHGHIGPGHGHVGHGHIAPGHDHLRYGHGHLGHGHGHLHSHKLSHDAVGHHSVPQESVSVDEKEPSQIEQSLSNHDEDVKHIDGNENAI